MVHTTRRVVRALSRHRSGPGRAGLGLEMATGQPAHGTVPSTTVDIGPQLAPPSVDRRITSAWCCPLSPQSVIRFSANASRLPVPARLRGGGRRDRKGAQRTVLEYLKQDPKGHEGRWDSLGGKVDGGKAYSS